MLDVNIVKVDVSMWHPLKEQKKKSSSYNRLQSGAT